MTQLSRFADRIVRWTSVAALAFMATVSGHTLAAQTPGAKSPPGFTLLEGYVIDSIHNAPLTNATVLVEGTSRTAVTDKDGHYRIDSIPAGSHRVVVLHPLLDTAGFQIRTAEYPFVGGEAHDLDFPLPSGVHLAKNFCSPAQLARGPGVMTGFVRDPDTSKPAVGSKVEVVYDVLDVIGRKSQTVRSAVVDTAGRYLICGVPADMNGKVQVFRNGVSSGEVPIAATNAIALRAFSIAQHQSVAEVTNDSGKVKRVARGSAVVTGVVTDKKGSPLAGARVALQGGGTVTVSRQDGGFTLDSLPSGTQALEIRKLGYAATEVAVELSSNAPAKTHVVLSDFVPTLAAMVTEAKTNKALTDVGYLGRKKVGMGFFMDSTINKSAVMFSDVMRAAPGLRMDPTGDGRSYVIVDTRSAGNGCVNYFVDGHPWPVMTPGDIDQYVRPSELVAVEVYHGSTTPPEYTTGGQSGCATIVVWTMARIRPNPSK